MLKPILKILGGLFCFANVLTKDFAKYYTKYTISTVDSAFSYLSFK